MAQIATFNFVDASSGGDCWAMVGATEKAAQLVLSSRRSGDAEVFLQTKDLNQLIDALQKARAMMKSKS